VRQGAGWPYYARPVPGGPAPSEADIAAARERQRSQHLPEAFEWIHDIAPEMLAVARRAGLKVLEAPLMVLRRGRWRTPEPPPGIAVRMLGPDDPALAPSQAVARIGFGHPGTAPGAAGAAERDAAALAVAPTELDFLRGQIRDGLTAVVVAEDASGPVASGSHQPVGAVTEITGVATLPSARRRGLGALVTGRLVQDARERGAELIFLSAGSEDIARVYARLGFERVGTACIAEPA
jgi:ribosomal protein S18 acetylase RimI-like enzyme